MDFVSYITVSFILFLIGLFGIFLNWKNVVLLLMSIELTLLSVNFILLTTSGFIDDSFGQVFSVFVLTIAASESSVGLAILVVYFRLKGTVDIKQIALIKG